eukprot:9499271-Pyramimonas_sp.AAC.1
MARFWAAMLGSMAAYGDVLLEGRVPPQGHPWAVQLQQDIDTLGAVEPGEDMLLQADGRLGAILFGPDISE